MGVVVALHLRSDAALAAVHSEFRQSAIERRFWSSVFPANGRTLIVPGDSGLVLYETMTGQEVTLANHVGGVCRTAGASPIPASQQLALSLASRRYTSIVDLNIASQLSHLPQWSPEHSATVFARDLKPPDADSSNLILIGSREANPWVSLAEPSMNFVLVADKKRGLPSSIAIPKTVSWRNTLLRKRPAELELLRSTGTLLISQIRMAKA